MFEVLNSYEEKSGRIDEVLVAAIIMKLSFSFDSFSSWHRHIIHEICHHRLGIEDLRVTTSYNNIVFLLVKHKNATKSLPIFKVLYFSKVAFCELKSYTPTTSYGNRNVCTIIIRNRLVAIGWYRYACLVVTYIHRSAFASVIIYLYRA